MKISIQIVIQVFFFILSHTTYGQNNYEEVVYLKNGSIIRGIIIEQIPNQNIKIQTKDRNVFVFKYEEIEKMTKEELPIYNKINKNDITNYKKKGFINITEINYCPGIGNLKAGSNLIKNVDYSLGLRTINGYQINENISLGLGFGFDIYRNVTLLPITFDFRVTMLKGKVSPVFIANGGYAAGLNDVKGGLIINPQIGIKTFISKNVAYLFNIGLKIQSNELSYIGTGTFGQYLNYTDRAYYQFFTLSTGFSF